MTSRYPWRSRTGVERESRIGREVRAAQDWLHVLMLLPVRENPRETSRQHFTMSNCTPPAECGPTTPCRSTEEPQVHDARHVRDSVGGVLLRRPTERLDFISRRAWYPVGASG